MKDLVKGQYVFNKEFKEGVVISKLSDNRGYQISFFKCPTELICCLRKNLFAVGDKVTYKSSASSPKRNIFSRDEPRIFIGYAPWTEMHHFVVKNPEYSTKKYAYVLDIEHFPVDEIEISVKLNGKHISLSDISEETLLNIRRES